MQNALDSEDEDLGLWGSHGRGDVLLPSHLIQNVSSGDNESSAVATLGKVPALVVNCDSL